MGEVYNNSIQAEILRDKYTKAASLQIMTTKKWQLFVGSSVESIGRNKPILEGEGGGMFPFDVSTSFRNYFRLQSGDEHIILAERRLPIEGSYNFRDLGGIRAKDGRQVKWGMLFRADELTHLTYADSLYLASIPITSVIDFRAAIEMRRSPDRLPSSVKFSYPLTITPGNLSSEGIQANLLRTDIDVYMQNMNRLLVSDPACVSAYRKFFNIIQKRLSAPIVFHCTAGKDRTGMAVALLLYALGVEEKTIMQDYMLSKVYIADKYQAFVARYPQSASMFTVKSSFLNAGLEEIVDRYGSIDSFLVDTLSVNVEKLREMYLVDYSTY